MRRLASTSFFLAAFLLPTLGLALDNQHPAMLAQTDEAHPAQRTRQSRLIRTQPMHPRRQLGRGLIFPGCCRPGSRTILVSIVMPSPLRTMRPAHFRPGPDLRLWV